MNRPLKFKELLQERCKKVGPGKWNITSPSGTVVGTTSNLENCKLRSKVLKGKGHKSKKHKNKVVKEQESVEELIHEIKIGILGTMI